MQAPALQRGDSPIGFFEFLRAKPSHMHMRQPILHFSFFILCTRPAPVRPHIGSSPKPCECKGTVGCSTLFFPAKDFPKRRKIFAKTPSRESNSTATDFNSTAADFNFGQLSWHSSVMGSKSLRTNFVLVRGELSSSLSYPERSRKKNVVQISGKSHFA